jgi:hypothetical protein
LSVPIGYFREGAASLGLPSLSAARGAIASANTAMTISRMQTIAAAAPTGLRRERRASFCHGLMLGRVRLTTASAVAAAVVAISCT